MMEAPCAKIRSAIHAEDYKKAIKLATGVMAAGEKTRNHLAGALRAYAMLKLGRRDEAFAAALEIARSPNRVKEWIVHPEEGYVRQILFWLSYVFKLLGCDFPKYVSKLHEEVQMNRPTSVLFASLYLECLVKGFQFAEMQSFAMRSAKLASRDEPFATAALGAVGNGNYPIAEVLLKKSGIVDDSGLRELIEFKLNRSEREILPSTSANAGEVDVVWHRARLARAMNDPKRELEVLMEGFATTTQQLADMRAHFRVSSLLFSPAPSERDEPSIKRYDELLLPSDAVKQAEFSRSLGIARIARRHEEWMASTSEDGAARARCEAAFCEELTGYLDAKIADSMTLLGDVRNFLLPFHISPAENGANVPLNENVDRLAPLSRHFDRFSVGKSEDDSLRREIEDMRLEARWALDLYHVRVSREARAALVARLERHLEREEESTSRAVLNAFLALRSIGEYDDESWEAIGKIAQVLERCGEKNPDAMFLEHVSLFLHHTLMDYADRCEADGLGEASLPRNPFAVRLLAISELEAKFPHEDFRRPHQIALALHEAYGAVGSGKQVWEQLKRVEPRHVQFDSLGHLAPSELWGLGMYDEAKTMIDKMLDFRLEGINHVRDQALECVEHRNFLSVLDFHRFFERTRRSRQFALAEVAFAQASALNSFSRSVSGSNPVTTSDNLLLTLKCAFGVEEGGKDVIPLTHRINVGATKHLETTVVNCDFVLTTSWDLASRRERVANPPEIFGRLRRRSLSCRKERAAWETEGEGWTRVVVGGLAQSLRVLSATAAQVASSSSSSHVTDLDVPPESELIRILEAKRSKTDFPLRETLVRARRIFYASCLTSPVSTPLLTAEDRPIEELEMMVKEMEELTRILKEAQEHREALGAYEGEIAAPHLLRQASCATTTGLFWITVSIIAILSRVSKKKRKSNTLKQLREAFSGLYGAWRASCRFPGGGESPFSLGEASGFSCTPEALEGMRARVRLSLTESFHHVCNLVAAFEKAVDEL